MGAELVTVMPSVNEQREQRKANFYRLHEAAEHLEVEGRHKSKISTSNIGGFCSAYYFRLPDCLLSCIDILTL